MPTTQRRIHPTSPSRMLAALCFSILFALPAAANEAPDSEEEPWYQIEAIVFEHTGGSGPPMAQRRLSLSYPGNWHQLIDPDAPTSQLSPDDGEYPADETPSDVSSRATDILSSSIGEADDPDFLLDEQEPAEEPFVLLPSAERRLSGQARALERSGSHRVLYHAAWRQPLDNRARTSWLLVRGGSQVGEHQELEGALRIYSERALFVQANLWKTRFIRTPEHTFPQTNEWPTLPPWPAPFGGSNPLFESLAQESDDLASWEQVADGHEPGSYDAVVFNVEHIAALNQTQRLELGDVLYLDHPSLGVLVQVTRYQREDRDDENTADVE